MNSPIRPLTILIADDHRLFNDAIAGLLRSLFSAVRQVFDGDGLTYAIRQEVPDLLLLDINLPKYNGLELAEKIRRDYSSVKIIIVTMYNQVHLVEAAHSLGLEGYVLKDSPSQVLLEAIETVSQGQTFFDPKLRKKTKAEEDAFSSRLLLTKREKQVVEKLITGQKAEDIAIDLGIGYETVKSYRKNIYLKLGVNNLAELIHKVRDWNV